MSALPGDWARDIADTYRRIAEGSLPPGGTPRRIACFAEAAKYEAIAARMDATGVITS